MLLVKRTFHTYKLRLLTNCLLTHFNRAAIVLNAELLNNIEEKFDLWCKTISCK